MRLCRWMSGTIRDCMRQLPKKTPAYSLTAGDFNGLFDIRGCCHRHHPYNAEYDCIGVIKTYFLYKIHIRIREQSLVPRFTTTKSTGLDKKSQYSPLSYVYS